MATISAFDPGVRYDDADKEAEQQRAAARDYMFRAQLQQQAARTQAGLAQADINSRNALGFADIADRGAGRAADLDKALAVDGSYKQRANDAAAAQLAGLAGQKDIVGLQGQNQIGAVRAGNEPAMGRLGLETQEYNDRAPALQAAAKEAAIRSGLNASILGKVQGAFDAQGATPVGGMYAPQTDTMGLYPKAGGSQGAPIFGPGDLKNFAYSALGKEAPVDPNAALAARLKEAVAMKQLDQAGSNDPALRASGSAGLKGLGIDVGAAGLSSGGLNTGNLDELSKVQSLVGPDIADLKSYSSGIHGWIGSGNEGHVLQAAASVKNKLDLAGASPQVKQQVLSDLYSGLTSSLSGTVYNLAGTDSLLAKLRNALGVGGSAPLQPQVRPDAQ